MKYACLALAVVAAVLVGLVLMTSQPASGQTKLEPANPTVTSQTSSANHWYYSAPTSDPELQKLLGEESGLERETATLVEEYARTDEEGKRSKTKARLAATLEKQFDLQQKRRDLEVARIEAQLKKLREIMRKRAESRQTIIDKRLDQLLREADGLGWTPPHGASGLRNGYFFAPGQPQAR